MIFISKKTCENCNEEYLTDKKYCPNCGVKNNDFDSTVIIDKIKEDVNSSKFFDEKIDMEIKQVDNVSFFNRGKNKFNSIKFGVGQKIHDGDEEIHKPKSSGKNKPPKNKIICPNCDTLNDKSSRFCSECSFPLKDIKICPSCGFITEHNDVFCGECGHKLSDIKLCPDCKKIMEIDAEFCGECGHKF